MTGATESSQKAAKAKTEGEQARAAAAGNPARDRIGWLLRYGFAAVLLLVGLMQLVNGLALTFYGTVATAPWQFLIGGGGSITGDTSLTPGELKVEALVRLAVGVLLVWPGGHLLRKSRRENGERSREDGGRS
ncbi:MAG: hypothetical protein IMX00_01465 [Limnochordales bacterium]|nr:hypothetical protein [Limnochordales bacterium]